MKQTRAVRLRRLALAALAAGLLAATALTPVMAEPAETGQTGAGAARVVCPACRRGRRSSSRRNPASPMRWPPVWEATGYTRIPLRATSFFPIGRTGRLWSSSPADIREDKLTKGANRTNLRSLLVAHYVELSTIVSSPTPLEVNSSVGSVAQRGRGLHSPGQRLPHRLYLRRGGLYHSDGGHAVRKRPERAGLRG